MADLAHRIGPEADGIHATGPDPWWREAWYFEFFDPAVELQFQAYQGVFPNAGTGDLNAAVFHGGRRVHQLRKMDYHVPAEPAAERLCFGPMKLDPIEPLQRWRIRYDVEEFCADLTFSAVHPPFSWAAARLWMENNPDPALGSHHFDQLGRYRGEVFLEGQEIRVDALGFRDRMWGWGGRKHWRGYLIMWAAFDEEFVANVALQRFDDGRTALCGYLRRDGQIALIEHAVAQVDWHPQRWKTVAGVHVVVQDRLGRSCEFTGRPQGVLDTGHRWRHRSDHMLFSVGEYRCGEQVGHGVMNWAFASEADQLPVLEATLAPEEESDEPH